MTRKVIINIRYKAASAALAFISLASYAGNPTHGSTLPPLSNENKLLHEATQAFRNQEAAASRLLEDFLNSFPASVHCDEVKLMLADCYFYEGEYPKALQYYNQIRDNAFSGNIKDGFIYRKGYSLLKTGFYDEAALYFGRLLNSGEYGDASQFYAAYITYVKGDYDKAYDKFRQIQSAGSKKSEAEYYINQIDYIKGDYKKVADTSQRLLGGTVPEEMAAETLRVGGLSNFKLGNKAKALEMLSKYVASKGDGAELSALYSLASLHYEEGNYEAALPLFSIVTEYPGDQAQSAWLYIGQINILKGDSQAASLAFEKAARESWDRDVAETAAYNLAVTSTKGLALPFSDASKAMENFIETFPNSPYSEHLSGYLANAYYNHRDYRGALRLLDKINSPDESVNAIRQKSLYQLGVNEVKEGNTAQAIKLLKEASARSGPDKEVAAHAALWLGDAYYKDKNYSAASGAYEAAISGGLSGYDLSLARYDLGYTFLKLKNYKKAEIAFKEALASRTLSPQQQTDARLRYADCLYYNGRYSEALAIFRDIKLEGGQESIFAAIREADILGRNGQVSDKISILEGLSRRDDAGIWRSTVISRLADAYSEKGDDKKAAELYASMIDDSSASGSASQIYYSLAANAENLLAAGDKEAAYKVYRRLADSGIESLYPTAISGLMQTASDYEEIAEYASKVASLPGISPEERNEALYLGAEASLYLPGGSRSKALATLKELAYGSDRNWAARAAVKAGETFLHDGNLDEAEAVLLNLADNGSDDNYWLARGYITLSDVYHAQNKDYLSRLYLENLQSNYPGKEREIFEMINQRLKSLKP